MGITRLAQFWPEWKIIGELGQGAFGTVYKAVDEEAGFPVYSAIKVLSIPSSKAELDALRSEGMTQSETKTYFREIVESFVNEIKLMHTLKGAPNIVGVEAFKILEKTDSVGWDIYIRMELLCSFNDYFAKTPLTEAQIIKVGTDIASALEICQKENIIHRDIKPANIFADKYGNFKLGDFGIAKELEKTSGAVSSKGTFSYMAPEVARGERYDATVDIYSLGLVLYSLCNNNRPPFVDPNKAEVGYNERREAIDRRMSGEPLPPPVNASEELANIIVTCCSFDPESRFKPPAALKNALIRYRDSRNKAAVSTPAKIDPEETVAIKRIPVSPEFKKENIKPLEQKTSEEIKQIEPNQAVSYPENRSYIKRQEESKTPVAVKKKKSFAGIMAIILIIAICIGAACYLIPTFEPEEPSETIPEPSEPATPAGSLSVGSIIKFGSYEQDNNISNGAEAIEWQVLDVQDGKALVISKYALDAQPYNEDWVDITWEDCTLRQWLNDDFYNSAFTAEEKANIIETTVVNEDNPDYGTEGGNNTSDNIFLLSISEAEEYFASDSQRECKPTSYAVVGGAYESSNGNCWWWLRSPGYTQYGAADVRNGGSVSEPGDYVTNDIGAVRPALWIELKG